MPPSQGSFASEKEDDDKGVVSTLTSAAPLSQLLIALNGNRWEASLCKMAQSAPKHNPGVLDLTSAEALTLAKKIAEIEALYKADFLVSQQILGAGTISLPPVAGGRHAGATRCHWGGRGGHRGYQHRG